MSVTNQLGGLPLMHPPNAPTATRCEAARNTSPYDRLSRG
jgi:hypothetical protein